MNNVIKSKFDPVKEFQEGWITQGIDREGVDYLENLGYLLCDKDNAKYKDQAGFNAMTVSQIRNIFGEIKRIVAILPGQAGTVDHELQMEFLLLRPKIAYNTARVMAKSRKSRVQDFKSVLEIAHRAVDPSSPKHIRNFSQFVEGIVAYHKVYGGKE